MKCVASAFSENDSSGSDKNQCLMQHAANRCRNDSLLCGTIVSTVVSEFQWSQICTQFISNHIETRTTICSPLRCFRFDFKLWCCTSASWKSLVSFHIVFQAAPIKKKDALRTHHINVYCDLWRCIIIIICTERRRYSVVDIAGL